MKIKICCISDTHGKHKQVEIPQCDILIHAGDYTIAGEEYEVRDFLEWFTGLNQATYKVFIEGNHDKHTDEKFAEELKSKEWVNDLYNEYQINRKDTFYLLNSSVNLFGLNIYGSPVTPSFYPEYWAHNVDRGRPIEAYWKLIPDNTDILITHGPPAYICDYVNGQHVGCTDLRGRVEEIKPKLHVFGHLHENYGVVNKVDTIYINAALLDNNYKMAQAPIVVIIDI